MGDKTKISSHGPVPLLTPVQGAYKLAPSYVPVTPLPSLARTSSFIPSTHPRVWVSPPDPPVLSRASGSESDVSQASCGSGSLETSKGKPLLSQNSRNLCLEVCDAIVESLGPLVEVAVAEELCLEPPVEGGLGGGANGVEGCGGAGKGVKEPSGKALGRGVVRDVELGE